MALSPDPDRPYLAQRAMVVQRLVSFAHISAVEAEDWVGRWEGQARHSGIRRASRAYWSAGLRWIAGQRSPSQAT